VKVCAALGLGSVHYILQFAILSQFLENACGWVFYGVSFFSMHSSTIQYYETNAERLALRYAEADETDPRLFVNREPEEVQLLFERIGFTYRARKDNPDGLGRPSLWSTMVFDYAANIGV